MIQKIALTWSCWHPYLGLSAFRVERKKLRLFICHPTCSIVTEWTKTAPCSLYFRVASMSVWVSQEGGIRYPSLGRSLPLHPCIVPARFLKGAVQVAPGPKINGLGYWISSCTWHSSSSVFIFQMTLSLAVFLYIWKWDKGKGAILWP